MLSPEQRLAELGWTLPDVVAPLASYTPTVRTGDHVYVSGQVPLVGGAPAGTGKVGAEVTLERAGELAAICALNGIAALKAELGELVRVRRVVKVLGFVASDPSFHEHPKVINGASDLIGEAFGAAGVHARSAVGVAALPRDVPVEVEMIAEVG
ncbi:enamine deaminase RidA (YjgF/YER057c/UK114 family) [Lipingzhangella halophila]|uniref:Enamine deaminase RidA (YjgF/YER057c/UK114 family) n=1 Tax=Lipingzhangella halophila TaxID=1783352 RepID=A0A7W7RP61_9ACTN|nr:RidA family protein [Lipingzhangella halophila]MBB4935619.1 enamine deaminase RidA (YjgF/YER057c/UK114 family) [Lipingzhangella halophila]